MKIDLEAEKEAGAKAYDELLESDWRLKLEEEALQRRLEDKVTAREVKKRKEEVKAKKLSKRKKKRRVTFGFPRRTRVWRI